MDVFTHCMYVNHVHVGTHRVQKRAPDSPGTGTVVVMSHPMWVLRTEPRSFARQKLLLTAKPSFQLTFLISKPYVESLSVRDDYNEIFISVSVKPNHGQVRQKRAKSQGSFVTSAGKESLGLLSKVCSPTQWRHGGFPPVCTCSHRVIPEHAQFKVTIDKGKKVDTSLGAGFSSTSQSMCEREGLKCFGHAQLEQ